MLLGTSFYFPTDDESKLVFEDNCPYTNKVCMDSQEQRSHGGF